MPVVPDTSAGRGAQLELPGGERLPHTNLYTPFLVTGVSFSEQEKLQVSSCFGGRNYTYAFGHDPRRSNCSVQFMGFLKSSTGDDTGVMGTVLDRYKSGRLSAASKDTRETAKLRVTDNKVMEGFINGLQSATANTDTSVQSFKMNLMIVEAQ